MMCLWVSAEVVQRLHKSRKYSTTYNNRDRAIPTQGTKQDTLNSFQCLFTCVPVKEMKHP